MRHGDQSKMLTSSYCALLSVLVLAQPACTTSARAPASTSGEEALLPYALAPASEHIPNLASVLQQVREQTKLPVVFPARVPVDKGDGPYYASARVEPDGKRYSISVDKTPDCNGAKYCRIGGVYAVAGETPQHYTGADNQQILTEQIAWGTSSGLFTPSHAKADYWPAMLEWQADGVLFHLDWKVPERHTEKATLLSLAESVEQSASH